jgi:ketosteroid isomerase-like protein
MSEENVEIVRGLQPQADLAVLFRDDPTAAATIEAAAAFFEPDFESVFVQPVENSTATGFAGLRAAWIDWLTPWESYRTEIEDIVDLGDRVAVLTRDFGRRKGMEREVDFKGVAIYIFRGSRIARIEFHFDRAEGLEAAGLSE